MSPNLHLSNVCSLLILGCTKIRGIVYKWSCVLFSHFNFWASGARMILSHCSFTRHFSYDEWVILIFMFLCYLDINFCKVYIPIPCLFFSLLSFSYWVIEVLCMFQVQAFLVMCITNYYKYFLPLCGLTLLMFNALCPA